MPHLLLNLRTVTEYAVLKMFKVLCQFLQKIFTRLHYKRNGRSRSTGTKSAANTQGKIRRPGVDGN